MVALIQVRIAYATTRLREISQMYAAGLNLRELASFVDHDGFDGVILGASGQDYHLEFTQRRVSTGAPTPAPNRDPDDLLVFYLPDEHDWLSSCARMLDAGFREVTPANPYWRVRGRAFADLEARIVILENDHWPP